jgi:hypothetical protein
MKHALVGGSMFSILAMFASWQMFEWSGERIFLAYSAAFLMNSWLLAEAARRAA